MPVYQAKRDLRTNTVHVFKVSFFADNSQPPNLHAPKELKLEGAKSEYYGKAALLTHIFKNKIQNNKTDLRPKMAPSNYANLKLYQEPNQNNQDNVYFALFKKHADARRFVRHLEKLVPKIPFSITEAYMTGREFDEFQKLEIPHNTLQQYGQKRPINQNLNW